MAYKIVADYSTVSGLATTVELDDVGITSHVLAMGLTGANGVDLHDIDVSAVRGLSYTERGLAAFIKALVVPGDSSAYVTDYTGADSMSAGDMENPDAGATWTNVSDILSPSSSSTGGFPYIQELDGGPARVEVNLTVYHDKSDIDLAFRFRLGFMDGGSGTVTGLAPVQMPYLTIANVYGTNDGRGCTTVRGVASVPASAYSVATNKYLVLESQHDFRSYDATFTPSCKIAARGDETLVKVTDPTGGA